jgi:hypothetical protein
MPGQNPFTIGGLTLESVDCPQELSIGTGEQKIVKIQTVGGGTSYYPTGFFPELNVIKFVLHVPNIDTVLATLRRFRSDALERLITWRTEQYYGMVRKVDHNFQHGGNSCQVALSVEVTRDNNGSFSPTAPIPSASAAISSLNDTAKVASLAIDSFAKSNAATKAQLAALNTAYQASLIASEAALATALLTRAPGDILAAAGSLQGTIAALGPLTQLLPSSSSAFLSATQGAAALALISATLTTTQSKALQQQQGGSLWAVAATVYGDITQIENLMNANDDIASPLLHGSFVTTFKVPSAV